MSHRHPTLELTPTEFAIFTSPHMPTAKWKGERAELPNGNWTVRLGHRTMAKVKFAIQEGESLLAMLQRASDYWLEKKRKLA